MPTIKDYRIKISADLQDFEKTFSSLSVKIKDFFREMGMTAKSYGEVERAERIATTKTTIEENAKILADAKKSAKEAAEEAKRERKRAEKEAKEADPEYQKRLANQKAAEKDYYDKLSQLRKHSIAEAETEGLAKYSITKKRLQAEAELAAANVKRLEALRDMALAKAAGDAEKEFKIRTQYEKQLTTAKIQEAKKQDAAGFGKVVSSKLKGAAEFGENIATIAGGGLDQGNLAGLGAMAGEMIAGPVGGAIGSAIGEGAKKGMEIINALIEEYDPARIFNRAVEKVKELNDAAIEVGDSVKLIGKDIEMGDVDQGFKDIRESLENMKKISPEISSNIELILNMPGAETINNLKTMQGLMQQIQTIAKNDALIKQMEATDNAMAASRESISKLIRAADESVDIKPQWMQDMGAWGEGITTALSFTNPITGAVKLYDILFDIGEKQTANYSDQQAQLSIIEGKQRRGEQLTEDEIKNQKILTAEIERKKQAQEATNLTFEAAATARLQEAERAKGSALTEEEINKNILAIKEEMQQQAADAATYNNTELFVYGQIENILEKTKDHFATTNSLAAQHNSEISALLKNYDEADKLLTSQLDTIIATGETEQEKNEVERESIEIKLIQLQLVDNALTEQIAAIDATIAAQGDSIEMEKRRLAAAQILRDKQQEIADVMAGMKDVKNVSLSIEKGDIESLRSVSRELHKQQEKTQKGIETLRTQYDKLGAKKFDASGAEIKGGRGGAAARDTSEADAKKLADEERKAAEEAAKARMEALKAQLKADEEAHKARLEEAAKIRAAIEERAKAEKDFQKQIKDFVKNLEEQVKTLRESKFAALGGLVSDFIDPFKQALLRASQITIDFANEQKKAAELTEKQKQAIEDATNAFKEAKNNLLNLAGEKRELGPEPKIGTPGVQAKEVTKEQAATQYFKSRAGNIKTLADFETIYNAVVNDTNKVWGAGATAAQTYFKAQGEIINTYDELIDALKNVKQDIDSNVVTTIQAININARNNEIIETQKTNNNKYKASLESVNKQIEEQTKKFKEAAADARKLGVELENIEKANKEIEDIRPVINATALLEQLKFILGVRIKIADIQKQAETETDPVKRAQLLLEATKERQKLDQNIADSGKTLLELEDQLQKEKENIRNTTSLTEKLTEQQRAELNATVDLLKKLDDLGEGIYKRTQNQNILQAITFETELKELELAHERGEYNGRELEYLRKKAELTAKGIPQVKAAEAAGFKPAEAEGLGQRKAITGLAAETAATAQLDALNEALGIITEQQKVFEKHGKTLHEINQLKIDGKITDQEALELEVKAMELREKELENLRYSIDETLGLTSERDKAEKKYKDTKEAILKLGLSQEETEKRIAAATKNRDKEINDARVKLIQEITTKIAGYIDLAAGAFKDIEAMATAATVSEGITAGADLVTKIGTALLDAPYPMNLVGAVMVGGALITKAINNLVSMFIPVQQSKEDAAKQEAEAAERLINIETRLLDLENARVQAMQNLADLGEKTVDQAWEQFAAEKKIHEQRIAESATARQLAGLSSTELTKQQADTAARLAAAKKQKDDITAELAEAERLQQLGGISGRIARGEFLKSLGLDYGGAVNKGVREVIEGNKADLVKIDATIASIESTEGLINAELEWRKKYYDMEKAILDAELSLLQLRAHIEGETTANLEAQLNVEKQILANALAKTMVSSAGKSDAQYRDELARKELEIMEMTDDELKNILLTSDQLSDAAIAAGTSWWDAKTAVDEYGKSVNDAAKEEDKLLTALIRKHQKQIELFREAAKLQGGQMTGAQKAELVAIRDQMVKRLTETGATPNEIKTFLESLPEFAKGGIVPGAKGEPVNITAHAGEFIIPAEITNAILQAMNSPYNGGSTGVNLLSMPAAKILGESMKMKEAAIYNISNNINIVVNQKNDFASMEPQTAIEKLGAGFEDLLQRGVNRGLESGKIDIRRS